MNFVATLKPTEPQIKTVKLWISDDEVRVIFKRFTVLYRVTDGRSISEVNGIFIREKRSNEGTLGYVFYNALDKCNYLWVISKKDRKPFKLAKVK